MPQVYHTVKRLIALRRLLARRGSLTASEAVNALAVWYAAEDESPHASQRCARRDLENLQALGFPVRILRFRGAREAQYFWGELPGEITPRRVRRVCAACGRRFYREHWRKRCDRCERQRQGELKAKKREDEKTEHGPQPI